MRFRDRDRDAIIQAERIVWGHMQRNMDVL